VRTPESAGRLLAATSAAFDCAPARQESRRAADLEAGALNQTIRGKFEGEPGLKC
jgi:hypothetical protein